MILFELCKYFSRFVSRTGIENFFLASSGDEYDKMSRELLALPDTMRIPELTGFIFGIDETAVKQRISQVAGCYLFVDYSGISSSVDKLDVKTDLMHIAVTVAMPRPSDEDQFANMISQDRCLEYISVIRSNMRYDIDKKAHIEWMVFPSNISPFVAKELSNSFGWTMEFDVKGIDIV